MRTPVGLLLILAAGAAFAGPAEDAAEAARAAYRSGDAEALKALAAKDEPDPWLVADLLIGSDEAGAAAAWAAATSGSVATPLAAYVASREGPGTPAEFRSALSVAAAHLSEGRWADALAALPAAGEDGTVAGWRAAMLAGRAQEQLGQARDAQAAFARAADLAKRLNWAGGEIDALLAAAAEAVGRGNTAVCEDLANRGRTVAEGAGDRRRVGRALRWVGRALLVAGRLEPALATLREAGGIARERGDGPGLAAAQAEEGIALDLSGRFAAAEEVLTEALARARALLDQDLAMRCVMRLGNVALHSGRTAEAEQRWTEALAVAERLHDEVAVAGLRHNLGHVARENGEYPRAAAHYEGAAEIFRRRGNLNDLVTACLNAGDLRRQTGDAEAAVRLFEEALQGLDRVGDSRRAFGALVGLAQAHRERGDLRAAGAAFDEAARRAEAEGDTPGLMDCLNSSGTQAYERGDSGIARERFARTLDLARTCGDEERMATATLNLANCMDQWGEPATAERLYEEVMQAAAASNNRSRELLARINLTRSLLLRGEYARALTMAEQAEGRLDDSVRPEVAHTVLQTVASVYIEVGENSRARNASESALRRMLPRDRWYHSIALLEHGKVLLAVGEDAEAEACLRQALTLAEKIGRDYVAKGCRHHLARLFARRGDRAAVVAQLAQNLGRRPDGSLDAPGSAVNLAAALLDAGEIERGASLAEEALRQAPGNSEIAYFALGALARARFAQGRAPEAVAAARDAVRLVEDLGAGLGDEHRVGISERYSDAARVGALAAAWCGDAEAAVELLESLRGTVLAEALGRREDLAAVLLPPAIAAAERDARAHEAAAAAELRRAEREGRIAEIRVAQAAFDGAREEVRRSVARAQREAHATAAVVHPRPANVATIRKSLRSDEALVLYGIGAPCSDGALAAVVCQDGARVVILRRASEIRSLVAGFDGENPGADPGPVLDGLREYLVAPLGLGDSVARVFVVPDDALHRVPFPLLFGNRPVALVPSGTVLAMLRSEAAPAGAGVLALGDPDYESRLDAAALAVHASGARSGREGRMLPRLPHSGGEARAVGDVVLLRAEASEEGFLRALGTRTRWRAVHLACHGLTDLARPAFSSLALSPSARTDGFLSVIDVMRISVSADLVVLSACRSGGGAVASREGLLGLPRAFLVAGAPRVICSLWKVDDAATAALMTKFYLLWNPRDGSPGLPAAGALKAAQEFVRSQEQWKHPYYWAAWVLWGLAE